HPPFTTRSDCTLSPEDGGGGVRPAVWHRRDSYQPNSGLPWPDRAGGFHHACELGALIDLAQWITGGAAGKAALRADRQAVGIDVARRLADAPPQRVHALELRRLAADKPEHHALVRWYQPQRREIARTRRVVFQQEVPDLGAREQPLRHPAVTALGKVVAL